MEAEDHHTDDTFNVDVRNNLRNLWHMLRPYKNLFIILLGIILFVEASYVFEKYLLKIVIDRATEGSAFIHTLITIGIIFGIVVLLRSVLKFINIHLINQLDSQLIVDIKERFFGHLIELSTSFHHSHKTGSMISRLGRGSNALEALVDVIVFNFAPMIFMFIVAIAAVWSTSTSIAVVLTIMVVLFVGYGLIIQRAQLNRNVAANNADDYEKGRMSDFLLNIESIKYYGKEDDVRDRYRGLVYNTKEKFVHMWNLFRYLDAGHALIIGGTALGVVYISTQALIQGTASAGDVAFVYTVYISLLGPLFGFVHGARNFTRSMADFESLFSYEQHHNEIKDKSRAKNLVVQQGKIEFRNVTFSYTDKPVIKDFNLVINPNEKVAFVGHSGSGKTTLIKLLYRLYDIDQGSILIDGHDLRDVKQKSLRSELSIVPQEALLFDDTLINNIRFANKKARRSDVFTAIEQAQLSKVVDGLPHKEETVVGERGVKLSGGEKQRVSIARAILADKKILVLDEATSALDSKTEHDIQSALDKLMKGRTSIIIAHRLSTIMHADKIVVLDKGSISQVGTHEALVKQKGIYKELWKLQKGGFLE